ncbi:transposon Tf2-6 polyprotein [Trichonephila clavipes]|nr:transposon Tf2-6 polyprotein [Trichonephila clavipes]
MKVIPTADMTAETVCRALLSVWLLCFGCPAIITTDQGTNFESSFLRELSNLLGTNRIRCCTYHPKANGLVERLHHHIKSAIKAHENSKWSKIIPIVLLGMRSAVKKDINATCAELVYGTTLRLPSDLFSTDKITTTCNQTYVSFLSAILSKEAFASTFEKDFEEAKTYLDRYCIYTSVLEKVIQTSVSPFWLRNPSASNAEESYSQKLKQLLKIFGLEVEGEQRVLLTKSGLKSDYIITNKTEQHRRNEDINTSPTGAALVSTDKFLISELEKKNIYVPDVGSRLSDIHHLLGADTLGLIYKGREYVLTAVDTFGFCINGIRDPEDSLKVKELNSEFIKWQRKESGDWSMTKIDCEVKETATPFAPGLQRPQQVPEQHSPQTPPSSRENFF